MKIATWGNANWGTLKILSSGIKERYWLLAIKAVKEVSRLVALQRQMIEGGPATN